MPTTDRFRLWAGISAISAALQRNVFTKITNIPLYANLYLLFVSDPGVGKSNAINAGRKFAEFVNDIRLLPAGCTEKAFFDAMQEALLVNENGTQSPVAGFLDEFAVFLKKGDVDFMAVLSKTWDSPKILDTKTRTSISNKIESPCAMLVGGVTTRWMKEGFTDDAFETGFPARVIIIQSDLQKRKPLFDEIGFPEELEPVLIDGLKSIHKISGEFKWAPDAAEAFQDWVNTGAKPVLKNVWFRHYNERRILQIAKLSMIFAAARLHPNHIELQDYERGKMVLLEAETAMPKALKEVGRNPFTTQMNNIIEMLKKDTKRVGIPEWIILREIAKEIHPQYLNTLIESMLRTRQIYNKDDKREVGYRLFTLGHMEAEDEKTGEVEPDTPSN